MKKYMQKWLAAGAFVGLLLLPACSSDFLEVVPVDAVTSESYYQTEEQLFKALNAAYSPLGNRGMYGWWLPVLRDIMSDDSETLEQNIIDHHFFNVQNTNIRLFNRTNGDGLWNSIYMGILRCNLIIVRVPEATIASPQRRRQIEGEARFLRALYYYHLVTFWGRAPLLLDDNFDSMDEPAAEASAIYAAIEADLLAIMDRGLLPWTYNGAANQELGRATVGAALSLLGKVQLHQEKFADAAATLKRVIDQNVYRLIPVNQVFTLAGDNSPESIFEVQFNFKGAGFNPFFDDGINASESSLRNQALAPVQVGGWENAWPAAGLVNAFEDGDLRKKAFVVMPNDTIPGTTQRFDINRNKGRFSTRKGMTSGFAGWNPQNGVADENFPLIRFADVLLLYAEALIRTGQEAPALDRIDQVRARAFGFASVAALRDAGKGVATYMAANGLSALQALKHERRIELCFEGHRYIDLARWGDLPTNTVLTQRGWTPDKRFYPIPQEDIDLSTLLE